MKKQIAIILAFALTIALAGCTKAPENTEVAATTAPTQAPTVPSVAATTPTTAPSAAAETMIAVDVGVSIDDTIADDGTVLLHCVSQTLHLFLNDADVAEKITNDFLTRTDMSQDALALQASAKAAYNGNGNWNSYFYSLTYVPQRIDQKVLSFYGDKVKFTGAAHPEQTRKGASYDITTGDVLTLASIMTTAATTDDFCQLTLEALAVRAEGDYLREGYAEDVKRRFTTDASQDENWYFTNTGLCFYFDPYEIAPYTSGVITAEIPYEKLTGLVQPDYIPGKRGLAIGNLNVSDFTPDLADKSTHTAEMIMDQDGKMYLIHTEGMVQDIRITLADGAESYTVFAANSLSSGEAILVQATEENAKNLTITYVSNGESKTTRIAE